MISNIYKIFLRCVFFLKSREKIRLKGLEYKKVNESISDTLCRYTCWLMELCQWKISVEKSTRAQESYDLEWHWRNFKNDEEWHWPGGGTIEFNFFKFLQIWSYILISLILNLVLSHLYVSLKLSIVLKAHFHFSLKKRLYKHVKYWLFSQVHLMPSTISEFFFHLGKP